MIRATRASAMVAVLLVLFASKANAYWLMPTITPPTPLPQHPVAVVMHGGGCDDFFTADPDYPQVTQDGETIRIVIRTLHQTFAEFCDVPDFTFPVPLGQFPAGSYAVQVDVRYEDMFGWHTDTLGTLPLVVGPAGAGGPNGVPIGGWLMYLALASGIVLLARRHVVESGISSGIKSQVGRWQ